MFEKEIKDLKFNRKYTLILAIAAFSLLAAIAGLLFWRKRQSYDTNEKDVIYPPIEPEEVDVPFPPIIPGDGGNNDGTRDETSGQYVVPSFCPVGYSVFAGSEHFGDWEFASRDGVAVPDSQKALLQALMNDLEVLREELGGVAIHINSGFRTVEHNDKEGGKPRSQHLCATAADIRTDVHTPKFIRDTAKRLMDENRIRKGGLRAYNSFVHIDGRGYYVTW